VIATTALELTPIIIILGLYVWEAFFVLRRQLDQSSKLLRECKLNDRWYRRWRLCILRLFVLVFAAALLAIWIFNFDLVLLGSYWRETLAL